MVSTYRYNFASFKSASELSYANNFLEIDFGKFHDLFKAAPTDHAIKRGGNKKPVSEEAKIQSQRELVTLSALYTSSQSIPVSPQEPDSNNDGSQVSDKQPVIIPLPDNIKVRPCRLRFAVIF